MKSDNVIGHVSKKIEFAYVLIEAEGSRGEADHGDWDSVKSASHLIPGSLAVAVRVPMEGEVSLKILRDVQGDDLLPLLVFSGVVDSPSGRFVVSDPLDTFCVEFSSSGLFEVWVDDYQPAEVQVIVR